VGEKWENKYNGIEVKIIKVEDKKIVFQPCSLKSLLREFNEREAKVLLKTKDNLEVENFLRYYYK
jgi:hypothetical protein